VPRAATPCSITLAKEGYVQTRVDFQRQRSSAASANKVVAAPVGLFAGMIAYVVASKFDGLNPNAIASSA
jgi:hypothetical protein